MSVDYHIHIEQGNYTKEWVDRFIKEGKARGIDEFGIVEHTHRLKETLHLYHHIIMDNSIEGSFNKEWLDKRGEGIATQGYIDFIQGLKSEGYPIKLGIEVCYFPGKEEALREFLHRYPFDFVIGSVHWIDGWGFDFSQAKEAWKSRAVEEVYRKYFDLLVMAADSRLFDIIGHCDSIKIFNYKPDISLTPFYQRVATAFRDNNLVVEVNTGLHNRFGHHEFCPGRDFLEVIRDYNIPITLSSDAHCPEDTGRNLEKARQIAISMGYKEICTFSKRERLSRPLYIK